MAQAQQAMNPLEMNQLVMTLTLYCQQLTQLLTLNQMVAHLLTIKPQSIVDQVHQVMLLMLLLLTTTHGSLLTMSELSAQMVLTHMMAAHRLLVLLQNV
jgi:hypothetical protein